MLQGDRAGVDEILLEAGLLNLSQLKQAWDMQRKTEKPIEEILRELQLVSEKDLAMAMSKKMDMDYINLEEYEIQDPQVPKLIPGNMASRYVLIPIEKNEDGLTVAMKDPADIFALDDLRLATGMEIQPVMADPDSINALIRKYYMPEPAVKPMEEKTPSVISDPIDMGDFSEEKTEELIEDAKIVPEEVQDTPQPDSNYFGVAPNEDNEPKSSIFKDRIGRQMVRSGVITEQQLEEALDIQTRTGERLGEILVKENIISKRTLYGFLEKQLGIKHVDLEGTEISQDVIKLVSDNIARRYILIPIEKEDFTLKVAMSDPMNIFSIDDLRLATGLEILPLLADVEQVNSALDKYYPQDKPKVDRKSAEPKKRAEDFEDEIKKVNEEIEIEISQFQSDEDDIIDINDVENAPIVKMVNIILHRAVASGASDIHIEPYEDYVMIRYRIDGQLVETMKHDKKIIAALVARVKIMSGLNIAEKRIPQDGRIGMKIDGADYDLRVSILPTMFGEKIVIRITDKEGFNVHKKQLGFFDDDMQKFDEILSHPHGIVLVTGPTGSGKSTTLYTALRELCKPNVNILTVEDPVENTVRGINQVQVNTKAGLTFAAALRSFLRQDPDIIMVGEIRDAETAEIATRAAITGHLVLSTLHTNDAASSITRLIDMGIEPFMASSSIVGVIAQRLVRRLCPVCREEYQPQPDELEMLNFDEGEEVKIYNRKGCSECNETGYKGRIAVYEIMTVTSGVRQMISKNETSDVIKEKAIEQGMKTLRENGIRLVKDGVTTIEEVLRVTYTKE